MPNNQELSPEYIQPRVREFSSFDDALENYNKYGDLYPDLNEGLDPLKNEDYYKKIFLVGDPGYGKTRLFKEIVKKVKSQHKIAIYVDLKKFANSKFTDVENYVKSLYPELTGKDFATLKSTDAVFCFDALDEISENQFSSCLDLLKVFLSRYESLSTLISCRTYFFKHHFFEVNDPLFSFWLIYAFSNRQIRDYLRSKAMSNTDISMVLDLLTNSDRNLVISVPRYLELIPKYLENKTIPEIKDINRTDLFEYFIYNKLEIEEERAGIKGKEIVKRVLEMLALTMEIYQTNVLSKDDLTTFLDEVRSGLNQFWHKIPVGFFYAKSLLKDNKDTIEFENTEFQEYLAAKHISRLNKPIQVAFDMMIDKVQLEVKPTWFSTLNFLVEIDQNFLKPLLDFGGRNETKLVIDERYFQLLTRFNVEQLDPATKEEIFIVVFEYYQKVLHWLDWSIGRNLSYYFTSNIYSRLLEFTEKSKLDFKHDDQRNVQLANVVQIIGFLIRNNKLDNNQLEYWKTKLVTYANEEDGSGVLQRHSLFALEAFQDPELISSLDKPWRHRESLVRRRFIEFCTQIGPNRPESIQFFVEAVICQEYEGYQGINNVTSQSSLILLFKAFLENDNFLSAFMDRDKGIFSTNSTDLISNVKSSWSDDLKEHSHKIVIKAFQHRETWYKAGESPFILGLCKLMQENDASYIFQLIESISNSTELKGHVINFSKIFATILPLSKLDTFNEKLSQIENGKWTVLRTLREIKYSDRTDANQLYEEGRKYFPDEYLQSESADQAPSLAKSRGKDIYEDFSFKLQPEKGKFMPDVFSLFNQNNKDMEGLLTQADRERLVFLINDSIFSKFDPGEQGIQDSNNHQTHTMNSWISIFGDALIAAHKLQMDVSQYKDRIVNYLPFSFEQAELEAIFALVGQLSEKDLERLLARYKDRSNDLWRYHPRSLIETVKKYKLIKAVPLLKEFVLEPELSIYDRVDAMKAVSALSDSTQYLQEIFDNQSAEDQRLAEEANALLIVEYKDVLATKWRLEQLKTRAFTFVRPEGGHSMDSNEIELEMKTFAGPLYSVFDPLLESEFLSLLKKSFELLKQDKEYLPYSSYLWELVYKYFENRKREGNYVPINNLEKYLLNYQGEEGVNWFLGKLKELKVVYLQDIGKPQNYSSCVNYYNQIKESNYIKLNSHEDLLREIIDVIEKDTNKFLLGEGSKYLKPGGETEIQKQLKTEFENAFLRRNFRPSDIRNDFLVWRETQDISDKRCDFVITYGFLGPILIELKLTSHSEMTAKVSTLKTQKSFKSLRQYISSFRPTYSIFLVLDNKLRTVRSPWSKHLKNIREAYETIESVKVIGLPFAD